MSPRMSKATLTALITLIALIVFGIYGWQVLRPQGNNPSEPKNGSIIVILKTTNIGMAFWQTVNAGIHAAAKEFDVRTAIRGPLSETDHDEQIRLLEQAIAEQPRAIILAASNDRKLEPAVRQAVKAGIPLVCIDSGRLSQISRHAIAHDNIGAGKQAGLALRSETGGHGAYALIGSKQGVAESDEREQGILQSLSVFPEMEYLDTVYSQGDETIAYEAMRDLLERHPDMNGVVTLSEADTLGAAKLLKERALTERIKLIGFDSSIHEIMLLEEGAIHALVVQRPFNLGYLGVKTAVQILTGENASAKVDIDSRVITRANMHAPENQRLLFPLAR